MNRSIRQRKRIYVGCEGPSEQSYGKRLNEIADGAGLSLHFDCDVLQPGGGDPLSLIQLAVKHIGEKVRKRGVFVYRAVLLDKDKFGLSPARDRQIAGLMNQHKLTLIWQDPCHEAFLLRHIAEKGATRPPSAELALLALKKHWPEYRKGMPALELAARIDLHAIGRAASVEAEFRSFLQGIGFAACLRTIGQEIR